MDILQAPFFSHEFQRAANGREHAQGQDIDLQKAQGIDVVFVPLQHRAIGHAGVLHRNQITQSVACNDKPTHMLREMAREAHKRCAQPGPLLK